METRAMMLSLTFDDGYASDYMYAAPILEQAGVKGTFYISTGDIATPGFMNVGQLLDLQAAGQEIGAHSITHDYLNHIPYEQLYTEVVGSRDILESYGLDIRTFSYPYGEYNTDAVNVV